MASKVPPQLMPQFVPWLFRLVEQEDRATMTAVWQALMPEEVFLGVKPLIQGTLTSADWSDPTKRVPLLA